MKRPLLTLLTDFGTSDHYVAAMKGAMLSVCPEAQVIDISHEVKPYQILEAAYLLSRTWNYFPPGTVHVVVVDPGVGSSRRPILVEAGEHFFVAPDNGVLSAVLSGEGKFRARHLTSARFFRQTVSTTFHGRDLFGPAAAHLARGVAPEEFGEEITDALVLPLLQPVREGDDRWTGVVLWTDRFGNIVTNFRTDVFGWVRERPFRMVLNGQTIKRHAASYSLASEGPFAIGGSGGFLEISMKQASAAERLQAGSGCPVTLLCGAGEP